MPNRKQQPPLKEIKNLALPRPNVYTLDNGIKVYETNMGTQPILKLEIIFNAGRWYEDKSLVSRATASLLKEGTTNHTAAEIAETIDFYGGTISFPVNLDTSNLVLFCLTKHFDKLLPLVHEIATTPAFPESELDQFIKYNQQRLKVDLDKNDVVAYREVTEAIFGAVHPYGYNSVGSMYQALTQADLHQHFQNHYKAGNCVMILSGRPNQNTLPLLNQYFGRNFPLGQSVKKTAIITPNPQRKILFPKQMSVQTAIRIGQKLFSRHHPDYHGVYVLNAILGGYFGSRLMMNLREDKGYTYGAYSMIEPMLFDGYFYIGVEVGREVTEAARKEIYYELKRLREEPVKPAELNMVRNYLLGNLLTNLDGAFNVSEVIKIFVTEQLNFEFYQKLVHTIKTIQPQTLQALANTYLKTEDMHEVIVG